MARIAVVEDMGPVGDVTEQMARQLGHTVKRYGSPSRFEEARGWEDADIVLMDDTFGTAGNPEEVGSDYLKGMLRDAGRRGRCSNPPKYCIFSGSFHQYPEHVWEMNMLGVYYMEKPFSLAELETIIGYMERGKPPFWVPKEPTGL